MNTIKKIFPFLQSRKDILERCQQRREILYRHVHFSTRINDDYTTDTFICIDKVRVAKVVSAGKGVTSEGEFLIFKEDVEAKMKYLRRKYYQSHKKEYII